jgi:hypothetical protein
MVKMMRNPLAKIDLRLFCRLPNLPLMILDMSVFVSI